MHTSHFVEKTVDGLVRYARDTCLVTSEFSRRLCTGVSREFSQRLSQGLSRVVQTGRATCCGTSGLYTGLESQVRPLDVQLTLVDQLLCKRIEDVSDRISQFPGLPFNKLQISFEEEFFLCRRGTTAPFWADPEFKVAPEVFLRQCDQARFAACGVEIEGVDERVRKFEARTVAQERRFPDSRCSLVQYFDFRAAVHRTIEQHFPDFVFARFSDHVHFSLADDAGTLERRRLDPRFQRLLELSLRVHWHDAYLLIEFFPRFDRRGGVRTLSATVNGIGDDESFDHYFQRRDPVRRGDPEEFHYEIRRTMPGSDRSGRNLPAHPMILAQGLLSAAVNTAISAYHRDLVEIHLEEYASKIDRPSGDSRAALFNRLGFSPILTLPCSLGWHLLSVLLKPTECFYEQRAPDRRN